jgi:hypothetical protein
MSAAAADSKYVRKAQRTRNERVAARREQPEEGDGHREHRDSKVVKRVTELVGGEERVNALRESFRGEKNKDKADGILVAILTQYKLSQRELSFVIGYQLGLFRYNRLFSENETLKKKSENLKI